MSQSPPDPSTARRNLITLFCVSVVIGLGVALYNEVLPLFLKAIDCSWKDAGRVYTAGAVLVFAIRVGLGAMSDRFGRKRMYTTALTAAGVASLLTPFFPIVLMQAFFRSVAEPSVRAREAIHSVLLYEDSPSGFRKLFSLTRGLEYLFHGLGLLAAAWCVTAMIRHDVAMPTGKVLMASGALLLLSAAIFGLFFRGHKPVTQGMAKLSWRDVLSPNLPKPLWIMTIGMFAFNLAIMTSHCFALQWFFQEKFGATVRDNIIIGALHRFSVAIPLLIVAHIRKRNLKAWLIACIMVEGIFIAGPGLMPAKGTYAILGWQAPALWTAVAVWLLHDLVGLGVWMPAQQELLQRFSRPESRGKDVSLCGALAALGGIGGPMMAGWLRNCGVFDEALGADFAVNLPFIVSGIGVTLSALVLFALPSSKATPDGPEPAA